MKRIDRSSKGHYESETASRIATLGVHNLFEPYSNKLPLQRIAMTLTRMHATVTLLTVATPWYGAKAREIEETTGLPYGEVKDSI
jgi:hypothetical protein